MKRALESTAYHETGHFIIADHFTLFPFAFIRTGTNEHLFTGFRHVTSTSGYTHFNDCTRHQRAVVTWGGPLGEYILKHGADFDIQAASKTMIDTSQPSYLAVSEKWVGGEDHWTLMKRDHKTLRATFEEAANILKANAHRFKPLVAQLVRGERIKSRKRKLSAEYEAWQEAKQARRTKLLNKRLKAMGWPQEINEQRQRKGQYDCSRGNRKVKAEQFTTQTNNETKGNGMLNIAELQKERARLETQLAALDALIETMGGEIPVPFVRGRKAGRKAGKTGANGAKKGGMMALTDAVITALTGAPSKTLEFAALQTETQKLRKSERLTREDNLNDALKELSKKGLLSNKGKAWSLQK